MEDAVMANQKGVQVTAQSGEWPGEANIEAEVTPLRVIVQNQSEVPLQIRYDAFKLMAPDGTTYAAIPPRRVGGVVGIEGVYEPAFGYTGFYVAPYYSSYYPSLDPYDGPFEYDPEYYDAYYGYWDATTALPTAEMITRSLPEGVVDSGGSIDGFLYFERVRKDDGTTVTFQAELKQPEANQPYVSLRMPFVVD